MWRPTSTREYVVRLGKGVAGQSFAEPLHPVCGMRSVCEGQKAGARSTLCQEV